MFNRRGWHEESKDCWVFVDSGRIFFRIRKHKGESGTVIVTIEAIGGRRWVQRFYTQEEADKYIQWFKNSVRENPNFRG